MSDGDTKTELHIIKIIVDVYKTYAFVQSERNMYSVNVSTLEK